MVEPGRDVFPIERAPAFPIFCALCAGVCLSDRVTLSLLPGICACVGLLTAIWFVRTLFLQAVVVVAVFILLGMLYGNEAQSRLRTMSLNQIQLSEPQLVRLQGRIVDNPATVRFAPMSWQSDDETRTWTRCCLEDIVVHSETGGRTSLSGRLGWMVQGDAQAFRVGDTVETVGWLSQSRGVRNPGGFDLTLRDRQAGIRARLMTSHVGVVRHMERGSWSPAVSVLTLRRTLGERFDTLMSPDGAMVARAMLLGDRVSISDSLRDAYQSTGTMHILAISGMHMVILASLVAFFVRFLPTSPVSKGCILLVVIWCYGILTGLAPPVLRATLFITLWVFGQLWGRTPAILNALGLAGIGLIAIDADALGELGTQLSFLAVLGIAWTARLFPAQRDERTSDAEIEPDSWIRRQTHRWSRAAGKTLLMSVGIWLFTGPLIARELGIVSPIGILLNVVLVPLSTLVLWSGNITLAVCSISTDLAIPFAKAFDIGLGMMNQIVRWAQDVPGGHGLVVAPATWWMLGWLGVLTFSVVLITGRRWALWSAAPILAWAIVGILAPMCSEPHAGLRLTMLDVGHGGAILIEGPNGGVALYDCGSMLDERMAAETVWACLREYGHSELDALILSHADADHCNNVPELLRQGSVKTLYANRSFFNMRQPLVRQTCEAVARNGTKVQFLQAGDELAWQSGFRMRVLHPNDRAPGEDDNANSLVLELHYEGRRLLLTGDLEGIGQSEFFMVHRPEVYDVVVSPHHGGRLANTREFARWTRPRRLLVSCSDRVSMRHLEETYGTRTPSYLTSRDGAVTVRVSPDGHIVVRKQIFSTGQETDAPTFR